jgi:hypothetical protein
VGTSLVAGCDALVTRIAISPIVKIPIVKIQIVKIQFVKIQFVTIGRPKMVGSSSECLCGSSVEVSQRGWPSG